MDYELKQRVLDNLTHLPYAAHLELLVEDENVSILAACQRSLTTEDTHDVCRRFTGHAHSILQGHFHHAGPLASGATLTSPTPKWPSV